MLLVARDNRSGDVTVRFLPEGGRVEARGIEVERSGDAVLVHLPNQTLRLEGEGSVNLTDVVISFVPLERILSGTDAERFISDIERITFTEDLPQGVRRALRLYAALMGIKNFGRAPDTVKEHLILTVARLTGLSPEEIITNRGEVEAALERALTETLSTLSEEESALLYRYLLR